MSPAAHRRYKINFGGYRLPDAKSLTDVVKNATSEWNFEICRVPTHEKGKQTHCEIQKLDYGKTCKYRGHYRPFIYCPLYGGVHNVVQVEK